MSLMNEASKKFLIIYYVVEYCVLLAFSVLFVSIELYPILPLASLFLIYILIFLSWGSAFIISFLISYHTKMKVYEVISYSVIVLAIAGFIFYIVISEIPPVGLAKIKENDAMRKLAKCLVPLDESKFPEKIGNLSRRDVNMVTTRCKYPTFYEVKEMPCRSFQAYYSGPKEKVWLTLTRIEKEEDIKQIIRKRLTLPEAKKTELKGIKLYYSISEPNSSSAWIILPSERLDIDMSFYDMDWDKAFILINNWLEALKAICEK